jgi:hypothetical protein
MMPLSVLDSQAHYRRMGKAQFLLAVFRAASLRAAARPRTGRQIQANLVILAFAEEKRQTAVSSSRFPVASWS